MLEKQRCPLCYSHKYAIDFESVFQMQSRRGGQLASRFSHQVGVSTANSGEVSNDGGSSFDPDQSFRGKLSRGQSIVGGFERLERITQAKIQPISQGQMSQNLMNKQMERLEMFDSTC
mmetsp:Transcript_11966/g.20205  ORF Transcript_11966/g.20205 Transcript_11966/m.20205 type:complete len:118 (-) Transcript_11966:59-412(-)